MLGSIAISVATVALALGHSVPNPVWVPSAEPHTVDRRARWRMGIGAQDTILNAEPPVKGLGLVPGLRYPLWTDLRVLLNHRPVGPFEHVQLTAGTLINYDNFVPFLGSVRLLSRPTPQKIRIGFEPFIASGVDLNLYGVKIFASRRWSRIFLSGGTQVGGALQSGSTRLIFNVFAASGVVAVRRFLSFSIEGGSSYLGRHILSTNAILDLWGYRIGAGATHSFLERGYLPGFQVTVGIPFYDAD